MGASERIDYKIRLLRRNKITQEGILFKPNRTEKAANPATGNSRCGSAGMVN
jgi:hypothetical protein